MNFGCQKKIETSNPRKLIIDTDFGYSIADIDDMGALAVAHGLMNNNKCELLAIILSINNGHAVQALDVVNTYFGRGNIPIANTDGKLIYQDTSYAHHLAKNFHFDIVPEETLESTKLYRKLLSEAADNSITIAVIGFPTNINNLFKSDPDDYSDLNGIELVKRKVDKFYIMGGKYPEGLDGHNWRLAGDCIAKEMIEQCPRPIIFVGDAIGKMENGFIVGKSLNQLPDDSPVKAAFSYWFKNPPWWYKDIFGFPASDTIPNWHSWDEVTVHMAILGSEKWFDLETQGSIELSCKSYSKWNTEIDKEQSYIKIKMDPEQYSRNYIQPLMMSLPKK